MPSLTSQKIRQSLMWLSPHNPLPYLTIVFRRCNPIPQINWRIEQRFLQSHKDSPLMIVVSQRPICYFFNNLSEHNVAKIGVTPFAADGICWFDVVQICHDLLDDRWQWARIVVEETGTME